MSTAVQSNQQSDQETVRQRAIDLFKEQTRDHVATVLHNDAGFRRILFAKPGTFMYAVEVTAWPGHVAVTGDMGALLLQRESDMLAWAAEPGCEVPSFDYWAEKAVATDGPLREWSATLFTEHVRQAVEDHCEARGIMVGSDTHRALMAEVTSDVLFESDSEFESMEALRSWRSSTAPDLFDDAWEWQCTQLRFHSIWKMLALRHVANWFAEKQRTAA